MIIKEIIRLTNDWIMDGGDLEYIHADLDSISLPVWDELCHAEKLSALAEIYEGCLHSDPWRYTHSANCTPVEQAACAFCIEYFRQQDLLDILMEDCDFMMVKR